MGEIKFRVWDEHHRRFGFIVLGARRIGIPSANYLEQDFASSNGIGVETVIFPTVDKDFQQFTGLLDKNGKEIYEGDLLDYSIQGDKQALLYTVTIPDFFVDLERDDSYCRLDVDSLDIVGNIYENPELLK